MNRDWTGKGPDTPAPRLDPNCQCICHTQPGVMHVAACCQAPAQGTNPMTHDTPPKRIWAWYLHPEMRNDVMEGGWTESPDKREAEYILTSDAAAMVAAVLRVKPLQWKEYPNQGNWRADTPVGEYSVGFDDGWWAQLEGVEFWNWETPEDPRSYSGPEAGMNACKADYETRILATLEKIE